MSESSHARVSPVERERALTELSWHFSTGTLSVTEFDQRSAQALDAGSRDELAVLFLDLPRVPAEAPEPLDATMSRLVMRTAAISTLAIVLWLTFGSTLWLLLLVATPVVVLAGMRGRYQRLWGRM
ncbi:DUF1707 SHOCT-like domain-containing protein [Nocardia yamanashiensis]|uniref:DUF1707 SHOCT-like domain-containing protein n=1 Tax=Nocardia yamanashiensis TaxID=209247 RepID=UPI00082F3789|nr:DUF1707 domain-containing protein [Nocardia yamanashiensis]